MSSDQRREADRMNAQKSTGPVIDDAKTRARVNALKHVARDSSLVLPHEDPEAYRARVQCWVDDYRPTGAIEEHLVLHAADITWKLDRVSRYENAVLSKRIVEAVEACESEDPRDWARAADLASFDPSMEGERVRRYQSSLHRELMRTLDTLAKLQAAEVKQQDAERKRGPKWANEANSTAPNEANRGVRGASTPRPRPREAKPDVPNNPLASAPLALNEANAPNEANFEGAILPNEANFADGVQAQCEIVTKRTVVSKPIVHQIDVEQVGWLDVSCERR